MSDGSLAASAWASTALGALMASRIGSVDPSKYPNELFDLYSIPAFDAGQPVVVDGRGIGSTKQIVAPGDVLLSKIVPHIRRSWIVGPYRGRRIIASGEWIVFRNPDARPDYLRQTVIGDAFHGQFMATVSGVGGSLLRARPAHVAKIEILLPPLPEQRRIAEVLDRADSLRSQQRAAFAGVDRLTDSIFFQLFGDPGANSKHFPQVTLRDVLREEPNNGIFRRNSEYEADRTRGIPVVWVEELFRGSSVDVTQSRRLIPTPHDVAQYGLSHGDILFCRSSLKLDGIAFSNVYLGPDNAALFECHVIRVQLNPSEVSPIYMNALLRTPHMRAMAKSKSKTATMTTIDQRAICTLPIMLPSLPRQQEFERRLAAVGILRDTYRASLVRLDALVSSLQNRAFRGEL